MAGWMYGLKPGPFTRQCVHTESSSAVEPCCGVAGFDSMNAGQSLLARNRAMNLVSDWPARKFLSWKDSLMEVSMPCTMNCDMNCERACCTLVRIALQRDAAAGPTILCREKSLDEVSSSPGFQRGDG